MHKPHVPTVYNAAPPSYAEAMGQSTSTTHVPTSTQYQSTTYPQVHSQSFNYPTATTCGYPNQEIRSCVPDQSPYNPYMTANQQDQSTGTSYIINATVVAPTNATVRNNTKRTFWMVCVFIIWFIIIVSIFSSVFR